MLHYTFYLASPFQAAPMPPWWAFFFPLGIVCRPERLSILTLCTKTRNQVSFAMGERGGDQEEMSMLPPPPAFLCPQDRNRRYVPLEKTPVSPRPTATGDFSLSLSPQVHLVPKGAITYRAGVSPQRSLLERRNKKNFFYSLTVLPLLLLVRRHRRRLRSQATSNCLKIKLKTVLRPLQQQLCKGNRLVEGNADKSPYYRCYYPLPNLVQR